VSPLFNHRYFWTGTAEGRARSEEQAQVLVGARAALKPTNDVGKPTKRGDCRNPVLCRCFKALLAWDTEPERTGSNHVSHSEEIVELVKGGGRSAFARNRETTVVSSHELTAPAIGRCVADRTTKTASLRDPKRAR